MSAINRLYFVAWGPDGIELTSVPVVHETPREYHVSRCAASGFRQRVNKGKAHVSAAQAVDAFEGRWRVKRASAEEAMKVSEEALAWCAERKQELER